MFKTNKSWNPVLNMIIEIKQAFIKEFGEEELYSTSESFNVADKAVIETNWNYIEKHHLPEDTKPFYSIKSGILGYWVARLAHRSLDYLDYAKMIQPLSCRT